MTLFEILDFDKFPEECALCPMAVECNSFQIIKGKDISRSGCNGDALDLVPEHP